MGHSQVEKARNHERILDIAAARLREAGLDGLSVGALMKDANLTHGGFYGHFESKSDLVSQALDRALDQASERKAQSAGAAGVSVERLVENYLSPTHRDHRRDGCPYASLAADVARSEDPAIRSAMGTRLDRTLDRTAELLGGDRDAAIRLWSTMVGALILSRVLEGSSSDDFLRTVRNALHGRTAT